VVSRADPSTLPMTPNSAESVADQSRRFLHIGGIRLAVNLEKAGCPNLPVEGVRLDVIQVPNPEPRIMRYELTDFDGLPSGRSFQTNRVVSPVLTIGAS
jgi:hypothetical protein